MILKRGNLSALFLLRFPGTKKAAVSCGGQVLRFTIEVQAQAQKTEEDRHSQGIDDSEPHKHT